MDASTPREPARTPAPDRVAAIQAEWHRERPDLDPSPMGVIGRLHRTGDALMERLTVNYRTFGLAEGEFDLLATLRRAGAPYERAAGELADHTMITTGGLTKRVDRLEARGLVRRRVEASDGRRRLVALTDTGLEVIDAVIAVHLDTEHALVAELGAADAAELERILTRWLALLGED
ncbi:MarR family winged helix-turn-helix transcriptional regulator [Microbacterium sp. CJ88]|uniref:MarR family winged helix-turn-helix transcriptional regulator n=1 Tax=Microbacterium sp. CJ88 TaxID=3445672 RepID=UPI003F655D08